MLDFKSATDLLADAPTHHDNAQEIGVSMQTVRQARMEAESWRSRPPPGGWEKAIARLARQRAKELVKLGQVLEKTSSFR
jgi:hypothetical protein